MRGIVSSPITVAPCALSHSTPRVTISFPDAAALILRSHGEWTHPALGAGAVHHVERDDVTALVAPEHRALSGILDRVPPDSRVEKRHADADHPVATIALRERVAEDLIQLGDLIESRAERPFDRVRAPHARRRHQSAAPACDIDRGRATRRFGFDARHAGLLVVAHGDDAIESFAHRFDVRDEDDLLEAVLQPTQQVHDVVTPRLVERPEHLVEDQKRKRLAGALGDHLGDCEPKHQVR